MIKNPIIRRFTVALFLLLGPFTQFQTLYACETMEHNHDRPGMVCCCDKPGKMAMMGQDQTGMQGDVCCDISYQASPVTQASATSAQSQQILMLDAAQPPPLLVLFYPLEIILLNHALYFTSYSAFVPPDTPVYLLTRRFRL